MADHDHLNDPLAWTRMNLAHWRAAATQMTSAELGLYVRLCLASVPMGGRLPKSQAQIARLVGAKTSQIAAFCRTFGSFLASEKQAIRLVHFAEELERSTALKQTRAEQGKKGAEARWNKGLKVVDGGRKNGS